MGGVTIFAQAVAMVGAVALVVPDPEVDAVAASVPSGLAALAVHLVATASGRRVPSGRIPSSRMQQ